MPSKGTTGRSTIMLVAMWTKGPKKSELGKQIALPTGTIGPQVSALHNVRHVEPTPVISCIECKKRPAVALFEVTEKIFDLERIWHKLLCGECGFTIGSKRRMIYPPDDSEPYSVIRYSNVQLHTLVTDLRRQR